MNPDEAIVLARIIGTEAPTADVLARELLRHHRMHTLMLDKYARTVVERNNALEQLRRERIKLTKLKNQPRVRQLRERVAHLERVNDALLSRVGVLSEKVPA